MVKKLDLRGVRFGRLCVISEAGRSKAGKVLWLCRCDCGASCVVSSDNLRSGNSTSCGCYKRERSSEVNTRHGLDKHPLHVVWENVMKRTGMWKCSNDKDRSNYIARGISVCKEWEDFPTFYDWCISHGYSKGLQIDRIDNDRGYCPDNCRWVTRKQNANNRRCTLRLCDGTPLAEFASRFGIETSDKPHHVTNEYDRIRYAFKRHGEHSATTLVFDLALETFAKNSGFEYIENAIALI